MSAPITFKASSEWAATEELWQIGCTDGLPIIAPTRDRVDAMILASGLDPDLSLGSIPPRGGAATVEAIAVNAVMAGCMPEHFAVLIAGVQAVLAPTFDLSFIQPTTNAVFPGLIVNGPARSKYGPIASGVGALGPGNRANLAIGRAVRLVLINLGGGVPGVVDMALLSFGKISFCLAEAEEESPFEPLHVSRGFDKDESTVTAVAMDPLHTVASFPHSSDEKSVEALLTLLSRTLANPGVNGAYGGQGWPLIILTPDHANLLDRMGYDRKSILDTLADRALTDVSVLRSLNPELIRYMEQQYSQTWPDGHLVCPCPPERTLLMVAGGPGVYSFVSHSWQGGPNGAIPSTVRITDYTTCSI